ncbi:MAG: caspase family protein [Elusimicrobiales bacterium]|nr:caspase family protein [Elusimicrobiales bacterium]
MRRFFATAAALIVFFTGTAPAQTIGQGPAQDNDVNNRPHKAKPATAGAHAGFAVQQAARERRKAIAGQHARNPASASVRPEKPAVPGVQAPLKTRPEHANRSAILRNPNVFYGTRRRPDTVRTAQSGKGFSYSTESARRDPVQALKWYMRAAARGDRRADARMRALQDRLTPQQVGQARMLSGVPAGQIIIIGNTAQSAYPAEDAAAPQSAPPAGGGEQISGESAPQQEEEFFGTPRYETGLNRGMEVVGAITGESETVGVSASAAPELAAKWEFEIPAGKPNPDAIGVIMAPSAYVNKDIPAVKYALADARLMRDYFVKAFGIPEGNIIYAENPTLAQFNRIFGTRDNSQGQVSNYVKSGKSDVFVYYAGHGAPDTNDGKAYFIPVDGSPDYVKTDGYPLDVLYKNLAKLPARTVNVFIDACFSGGSPAGTLLKSASPLALRPKQDVLANINVFTSSSGSQISSWYDGKGHSLFTYYLLGQISAKAAQGGKLDFDALTQAVAEDVTYVARRDFGRDQVPQFHGKKDAVLLQYK